MHPDQFLALHQQRERALVERLEPARPSWRPALDSRLGARELLGAAAAVVAAATRRGQWLARPSSSRDVPACCATA